MVIGGCQKFSLIDYPGKISAVIFTQGCSFRCPFCHNPELVVPEKFDTSVLTEEIFNFLNTRKNRLEGVVISGGEPTAQKDLPEFLQKIKRFGFLIKLDTNGSRPEVLEQIISQRLADYIAMDIKAPFYKYAAHTNSDIRTEKIKESIRLIMNCGIDYEFRTTVLRERLSAKDILDIGREISGAKRYILQKFIPRKILSEDFMAAETYNDAEFDNFCLQLKPLVEECWWR